MADIHVLGNEGGDYSGEYGEVKLPPAKPLIIINY